MRYPIVFLLFVAATAIGVPAILPSQEAAAQLESRPAEREFSEAYGLFANQLYRQAIHAFSSFRQRYPDHVNAVDALYYQAEASLAIGEEEEAVALFRRLELFHSVHPLASKARLALGQFFYSSGQYERAIDVLDQVVEDEPPADVAARALYWMGESALNQGRPTDAIGFFRRAADEYRGTDTAPIALYTIGVTEVGQRNYDGAAEAFELLAARYPDSPYARNIGLALAEVYYEMNDFQRAVSEINRRMPYLATEGQERARFLLAESYNHLRDSQNAILEYRRFTDGNPNSPYFRLALYGLAWNYHYEGVHEWAAEHFARVRQGHSDDLAARGTYYEAVNQKLALQPERAIRLLEEFIERWPRHELSPNARFELAVAYYEQRRWDDAYDAFASVVEHHPGHELSGEALYLQGNAAIALGDFNDALRHFERAISLDAAPSALRDEVRFQRAWLHYRNDEFREAVRTFNELYEEAPRSDRGGESLFWAAESHYQLGELGRAAQLFTQYLQTFPGGRHADAAYYALGWTHFRQGNYSRAAEEFRRFLSAYQASASGDYVPYRTDAILRLGDSYYALKNHTEAIRTYRQVRNEAGEYVLYQIGQAFYNSGDPFEAINAFRELVEEYPGGQWVQEARYNLGYIFFQNQDYDQAITEYETLINRHPQSPLAARAQYGIGDALFNAGRTNEAIDAYRIVLERYPASPFVADAAAGIQYALLAMGDDQRAEEIIAEFESRFPNSPIVDELRFRLAEVKYQSGRTGDALADLQRFVRTSRNERLLPEAYYYLGSIYADRNQNSEAISYLGQFIDRYEQSARFPEAARRLGHVYLDAQRPADALNVFRRLESARQADARTIAEARYGQGLALLRLGRTSEAENLLREAITAAPEAPETLPAYLGLARVSEESGRVPEALQFYREVVDRSRDEIGAEALYRLGSLLLRSGNPRQAVQELSRMPVLFIGYTNWVAQSYLTQARSFRALGQNGDAVRVYDRIISEFGGTSIADLAAQEKAAL